MDGEDFELSKFHWLEEIPEKKTWIAYMYKVWNYNPSFLIAINLITPTFYSIDTQKKNQDLWNHLLWLHLDKWHDQDKEKACDQWLDKIPVDEGHCGDSWCKFDQKRRELFELHSREHVGQNLVYVNGKVVKDEKDEDYHHDCL